MPGISMALDARYVTQQGSLDRITLGELTDSKIRKYQKLGYYGQSGILFQSKEKTKKKVRRKPNIDRLFKDYVV